jgi:hypothetical protein
MKTYTILEGLSARPSDRFASETNDCTVNAISNVTKLPYPTVHAYLKAAGRRDRHGFRTYSHFGKERAALGHKFTYLDLAPIGVPQMTVASFVRRHPRGRFLVCISRHALCVADGVIIDSARAKPRARIRSAWRVESIDAAPTMPAVAPKAPASAGGSLKLRKVARGHFKTTVPVSITYGATVPTRRLANLEIIGAGAFRRSGVAYVGYDWTWRLTYDGPGYQLFQTGTTASLNAAKALFADQSGPLRNWRGPTATPTGWTGFKINS